MTRPRKITYKNSLEYITLETATWITKNLWPSTCLAAPISVAATPICVSHDTPRLGVTPMILPILPDPKSLWNDNQSIPRLDPLHPLLIPKRTVSLETLAVHHYNHQRALIMQRGEHFRYHQLWRKPFYGTVREREQYRKEIREQLKRQMEEKCADLKLQQASKVKEAEHLREVDRLALTNERQQRIQHTKAMTAYRDENKRLMEQRLRDRALTRSQEALNEKELLRLNPINWSGTLT